MTQIPEKVYKVSAIISVFKAEKFIKGCLEDLVGQTLFANDELEIIIVNSGSPENEEPIIQEYLRKYENIKYIRTEDREGIYTAWNRAIKASSGIYITNANADDRHTHDALEVLANELDGNEEVNVVYADFYSTNLPNMTLPITKNFKEEIRPDFDPSKLLEGCFVGPQPMWRKSVHEIAGYFNDEFQSGGDFEFWCRLVFRHGMKMKRIPQKLGLYYRNENGIELRNWRLSNNESGLIVDSYKKYLLKEQINKDREAVDIVLLTHNRLKYFHDTINSIYRNTRIPFRLIIVDNASDEAFVKYLKQVSILFDELILNQTNQWTSAFQLGIEKTNSDPFVVSDPDILVPELDGKCWLERLADLHNQNPEMGLIALNLDPSNKPAKMPDVYISEKTVLNDEITLSNVGTVMQAIKRKYFNFSYTTDWETCANIRNNGGKVGFAKNIIGYHLGWNEDKDYPDYMVDKFKYFKNNYGVDTYKLYTTDSKIIEKMDESAGAYYEYNRPEVQELVNKNSKRILDVGCGSGVMANELKQKLNAEVWGIELFEDAAERAASKLDKIIQGKVEEAISQLPDKYFDTIIFADVLEHLIDPYEVINLMKQKLVDKGEIIASLPNVRHWSVIKNLLEGKWDYEDAGLMDKTHLRFFTLKNAVEMFANAGFNVLDLKATMDTKYEYPEELMNAFVNAGYDVKTLQEHSQHYQYLLKTQKAAAEVTASIVIPVYNQLECTKNTVDSIYENSDVDFELVIVDNNSAEDVKNYLKQLEKSKPNVKIIFNTENKGFPIAVNQGLEITSGKYVVIANNDILVNKNWLNKFIKSADANIQYGIVSGISNSVSGVQIDKNANYSTYEEMKNYAEMIEEKNKNQVWEFPRVAFLCTLIKREVIDRIGGLDERFTPGNYEDDDYCLRAQIAGFKTLIAKDVFIHHEGSKSFKADGNSKYENLLNANKNKFVAKWGATPDEIWLKGKEVKQHSVEIPITGTVLEKHLSRGNIHIQDGEYNLALNEIEICVEEFEKAGKTHEGNISLEKLKELMIKLEAVTGKNMNRKNMQGTASTINV